MRVRVSERERERERERGGRERAIESAHRIRVADSECAGPFRLSPPPPASLFACACGLRLRLRLRLRTPPHVATCVHASADAARPPTRPGSRSSPRTCLKVLISFSFLREREREEGSSPRTCLKVLISFLPCTDVTTCAPAGGAPSKRLGKDSDGSGCTRARARARARFLGRTPSRWTTERYGHESNRSQAAALSRFTRPDSAPVLRRLLLGPRCVCVCVCVCVRAGVVEGVGPTDSGSSSRSISHSCRPQREGERGRGKGEEGSNVRREVGR